MTIQSHSGGILASSQNLLLRRLSPQHRMMLEPHARPIVLDHGAILFSAHEPLDSLYFPDSVFLSLDQDVGRSAQVEVAIVGREGMLGWPSLLSCDHSTHSAVVRSGGGSAVKISASALRQVCRQSPDLFDQLLQFVHVVIVQMAHSLASHLQDSLDQRLARWLLMRHDRLRGDVLLVHHDQVANGLNVRRASVTDWLHVLEGERLIRCTRGKIAIRDRAALETFAGKTYGFSESYYRQLIGPFGKSASALESKPIAMAI